MTPEQIEQLKHRYYQLDEETKSLDVSQLAFKISANSFYGIMGLAHFRYYDYRMAEAVTSTGQVAIKKSKEIIDNIFSTILKTDKEYVLYCDTDSVVGETLVYANGKQITIAEIYDMCSENYVKLDIVNKSFVKPVNEIKTLAFDSTLIKVVEKHIKYVMKHHVDKRMFKITSNNKTVTVTEDHSLIVFRDNAYIVASAKDLQKSDKMLSRIKYSVDDIRYERMPFIVEDIGVQSLDVYDIEVDDHHNFFANDILVHNSSYVNIQEFVEKYCQGKTDSEIVDYVEKTVVNIVQPQLFKKLSNFTNTLGIDKCLLDMKLECIGGNAVFLGKKKYSFDILYSEGVRYSAPKMKVMGIEIVRSSTPNVVKDYLKECLALCLRSSEEQLQKKVRKVKKEFMQRTYTEISFPRGVNGMDVYSDSAAIYKKGCPIHVRGSLLYNHTLKRLGLDSKYPSIGDGDKVKFVALKMPNPLHENVIAFPSKLPAEFGLEKFIDYKVQFQKAFVAPLENILEAIGWEAEETVKLDFE